MRFYRDDIKFLGHLLIPDYLLSPLKNFFNMLAFLARDLKANSHIKVNYGFFLGGVEVGL